MMPKWRLFLHNRIYVYCPLFLYVNHLTLSQKKKMVCIFFSTNLFLSLKIFVYGLFLGLKVLINKESNRLLERIFQGCHTFLKFWKCSGRKKNVLEVLNYWKCSWTWKNTTHFQKNAVFEAFIKDSHIFYVFPWHNRYF